MKLHGSFNWFNSTELQIIRGIGYNSKIVFLIFRQNLCSDPSLEPCQRDGSNEGVTIYILNVKYGKLSQNQLLQLCTARTAWSESDQAVRTVHSCNSW